MLRHLNLRQAWRARPAEKPVDVVTHDVITTDLTAEQPTVRADPKIETHQCETFSVRLLGLRITVRGNSTAVLLATRAAVMMIMVCGFSVTAHVLGASLGVCLAAAAAGCICSGLLIRVVDEPEATPSGAGAKRDPENEG